jgi:formate dehydrogenase major subunit
MVNVTIDGKAIQVSEGTTVLRAAAQAGITVPVLCNHPNLVPFGGCRLCVVEVEGMRTLQPACSLPVNNNMVVRTNSEKVLAARKFVLTLIFSDRNHFCPYCQVSGGDCELQNAALDMGMTHWDYQPNWKPYPVDASHPYLVLDHNRCILCRRCVRACAELAGNFTLGIEERGASSMLVCDVGVPFGESSCVACGSCSQVCPTGAIIDRRSAYQGLDKKVERTSSICAGCSLGCGIEVLTRDNRLTRVLGRWDAPVNQGVLCKVGRFLPQDEERVRITTPMVRKDGKLQPATWEEALSVVSANLKPLAGKEGSGVAALASARLPIEPLAAFKKIFKDGFHSDVVTTLEEGHTTAAASALASEIGAFETNLEALQTSDCVIVLGADLATDNQVMGFMVKRILPNSTALVLVDSADNSFSPFARATLKPAAKTEKDAVAGIAAAMTKLGLAKPGSANAENELKAAALKTGISADDFTFAAGLIGSATRPVFVYGKALDLPALRALAALADMLGKGKCLLGARGAANSLAAAQLGLDLPFKRNGHKAVYAAIGDDTPSQALVQQIEGVPFLAVQASYVTKLSAMADVVLPVEMWAETSGHFVNLDGRLQEVVPALKLPGEARSNLAALDAVAGSMNLSSACDWQSELKQRKAPVELALA